MKRIFATLAVATMMFAAPNAALAGGKGGGGAKCNGPGNDTCGNVTIIEGDDDRDGKIEIGESFCKNKADGTYLVNAQVVVCIGGVIVDVL